MRAVARARPLFFFFLKKKMERERPAAFARRLGIHKSSVTRAIAAGRLILGEDGLLDVDDNLQRWASTRSGTRPDVAARHEAKRQASGRAEPVAPVIAAAKPSVDSEPFSGETGTRPYWEARRLTAQNNLVKLGMALRAHRCYPREDIRREALTIGATLRASLERLVDQTAPRLAIMSEPSARLALLREETARLRAILNAEFPRALRRLRTRADKIGSSEAGA